MEDDMVAHPAVEQRERIASKGLAGLAQSPRGQIGHGLQKIAFLIRAVHDAAQVVGMEKYTPVLKKCLLPCLIVIVWALVFIVFADLLAPLIVFT